MFPALECNNFLAGARERLAARERRRPKGWRTGRKGSGGERGKSSAVARLRYGRIMREDRTGQGYCQPDGRHSADPRVPFGLPPATSKLLQTLFVHPTRGGGVRGERRGALSSDGDLTHACFSRESRSPSTRKYFNRGPFPSPPLPLVLDIASIRDRFFSHAGPPRFHRRTGWLCSLRAIFSVLIVGNVR